MDLSSIVRPERRVYGGQIGPARPLFPDEVARHRHHGRGFKAPSVARNGPDRRAPGLNQGVIGHRPPRAGADGDGELQSQIACNNLSQLVVAAVAVEIEHAPESAGRR